eukprot:3834197-Pyramimonas_sp.AAC.1
MRTVPLVVSVGPPVGPRNVVLGVRDARGRQHWDLRWGSLWGHGTLYWVGETQGGGGGGPRTAGLGARDACGRQHWTFGGASHEATPPCT